MSSYQKCLACGAYDFSATHRCKPVWDAIRGEDDYQDPDQPEKAFGHEAEDAALEFAERNHADWEYPDECEVWVRKSADDPWQKFTITAEMQPSFSASRKE
jgi:hypothetical protein